MSVNIWRRAWRVGFVLLVLAAAAVTRPTGTRAQEAPLGWAGAIEHLSLIDGGENTGGAGLTSRQPVSADGRFVVWSAEIPNPPYPSLAHLFRRDRETGQAGALIGASVQGPPVISGDGNHIAFVSCEPWLRPEPSVCDVYVVDVRSWTIVDASTAVDGTSSTGASSDPILSRDGRFLVFQTNSPTLLPPAAAPGQIVIRDRDVDQNGMFDEQFEAAIETVSVSSTGEPGNNISVAGGVSADGRFVAFRSLASNLVPGDTNGAWDVFLRDRAADKTWRVNVGWDGQEATPTVDSAAISMTDDGRFIAFAADDGYLTNPPTHAEDINDALDVIVYDNQSQTLTRIDIGVNGEVGNGHTYWPTFSADGRYISMVSTAANADPTATPGRAHVYVYDRVAGTATRVSSTPAGSEPDADSVYPAISGDGSFVTFLSQATNLTTGAPQGQYAVYGAAHFDVSPLELTIPSRGGRVSTTITAQRYVSWSAEPEDLDFYWIVWETPPFGMGSSTLTFSAGANPDPTPRSFAFQVRSRRVVITQEPGVSLTSISPATGPATGGTPVTLRGTGFEPDVRLFFDGVEAPVEFVDTTTLRSVTPEHAAGDVYVWVMTSDYRQALLYDGLFHYSDVTPPDIWMDVQGNLHQGGWYTSDVNVQFAFSDPDSQVTSSSGCQQTIVSTDTAGTTLSCSATSEGGTATKSVTVRRDTTSPGALILRPGPTLYRRNSIQTASYACGDGASGSGLESCVGPVASGAAFDTSVSGHHQFTVSATDRVGLLGTETIEYAVSSGVCEPRPDGLIGWWPGDNHYRDIAGGNDGAIVNGTASFYPGIFGTAMVVIRGAYVQVGDAEALRMRDAFTLSAWVYTVRTPGPISIVAGREGEYLLARFSDGTLRYSIANTDPGWGWVNTGVTVPMELWTKVALTYDGSFIRVYKNGVLAYTRAASGPIGDASPEMNDFRIAARQDPAQPSYFDGAIDDVEVVGRAMSADEIDRAFLSGDEGLCPLVSRVDFVPNPQHATYGAATTELAARLTTSEEPVAGRPISFKFRGVSVGTATTGADGVARLTFSITGLTAGTYPAAVEAHHPASQYLTYFTATGDFVLDKQVPVVTWADPQPIEYGTALGSAQLNATANVGGFFTYSPPAGTVLPPGSHTLAVTFQPVNTRDYTGAAASVSLEVTKATPVIQVNDGTVTYDGTPHAATGSVTGIGGASLGPLTFTYDGVSEAPVDAGTYTVVASYAGDANYAAASASATLTITKATPAVSVTGGTFTYDGIPHAATGSVTGVGGASLGPLTFTYNGSPDVPVNAGTYTVVATFAGSTNYNAASATTALTINKATPKVVAIGGTFTYDGLPHAASGSAFGIGGVALGPLTFSYNDSPNVPVNAGSYVVVVSYAGDTNYKSGFATATVTIAKATPTVSVVGGTFTYDGAPHAAAGSVTGAGGVSLEPLTFTYNGLADVPANAGSYAVVASFSGDSNYRPASATATLTITKAVPTVDAVGGTFTYDATPHGATGSVTGVGGAVLGPLTFTYNGSTDVPVNAGSYAVVASYAGDANYAAASATATLTIDKATPVVSAAGGDFTYDGQAHAATGSVTGVGGAALGPLTFTYDGSADTPVNAGSYAVVASYAGDTNYAAASATATVTIDKATPVVSAAGGDFTYDGQPHPATGSVTGAGGATLGPLAFTYNGSADAPINAGSYSVVASYAGDTNYHAASATASIAIAKATATLEWNQPAPLVYGTALGSGQLNATADVAGTFAYEPGAGTVLPAGAGHALAVTFTPHDIANYTGTSAATTIDVVPAPLTIRADDATKRFGTPLPSFSATMSGFVNGDTPGSLWGTLAFATTATAQSAVGTYPIIPSGVSSSNYAITFVSGTLTIVRGAVLVGVSASPQPSGLNQPMTFTATVSAESSGVGTPGGTVRFFDGATLLGTSALDAGSASLTTAGLPPGTRTIEARYDGDASFETGAGSGPHTINDAMATPALSLSSSKNPANVGQAVTLTAEVAMPAGPVAGNLQFYSSATLLATAPILAGRATLTTSSLPAGSHAITARYAGSASAPPSYSPVLVQAIGAPGWKDRPTATTLSADANPVALGDPIVLTASVTGGSGMPTGRVLLMVNGAVIAEHEVTPASGSTARVTVSLPGLAHGNHTVTVTYLGDPVYKGSTAQITQSVD